MTTGPDLRGAIVLTVCCLISGNVLAHIKNEASQFPDIEFSESRFDIVVLVGAGIILLGPRPEI